MGENQEHYPRDLRGYAGEPPHARWPGGARIAVQFVLNYEEGAENHVLHGDAGSEQFLSDIIGAASYPARHMSMDSLYEYGSRAGFWRIHREFSQRGLPLTVFGVAMALARHPRLWRRSRPRITMWSATAGAGSTISTWILPRSASICAKRCRC